MHNQLTHRSNPNTHKYVTPRKTVPKHKKINIQFPDLPIHIFPNNPTYQHNHDQNYNSQNNSHNNKTLKLDSCLVMLQKQWKISDFQIIKQMGRGKFGYVYAAKQKKTDYLVAIKKMNKKELKDNDFQEQVKRQIIIQASLNHCNVLKLYGYFWDYENVYLILQYAPQGQLFNILQKNRTIPQPQVSIIIRQICQGLDYLHSNFIIHRDIKPQNILVSSKNVKIGDFGWSIQTIARRQTLCGTMDYLAPEIVKGLTHDSSIDIWQVGILAYELAVGHPPFQTSSNEQTYAKIVNEDVQFPSYVSYQLSNFIIKILQKNPNKRMTCLQILKQPFIQKYMHKQLQLKNLRKIV